MLHFNLYKVSEPPAGEKMILTLRNSKYQISFPLFKDSEL